MPKKTDPNSVASEAFKYFILIVLVLQNSSHALTMRYSRISRAPGESYIASTAVFSGEVMKLLFSSALLFSLECEFSLYNLVSVLRADLFRDLFKLIVPALLYVVQNNLTFLATSNLPAEIYQALSNIKVLSTAMFTVVFLGRPQNFRQWVAILSLSIGISAVQLSQEQDSKSGILMDSRKNMVVGLLSVISASVISGFAGVYFEMVLKNTTCSIWVRNIQLAIFSLLFAGMGCYVNDFDAILTKGFFYHYDGIVLVVITVGAVGGIVVAIVIKYLDNILKSFASGFSIILTCIMSTVFIHDESTVNLLFVFGTISICFSIIGYTIASAVEQS
jgi:solute carrier family 35 (UDP-sugar transporter), member A1/2/3